MPERMIAPCFARARIEQSPSEYSGERCSILHNHILVLIVWWQVCPQHIKTPMACQHLRRTCTGGFWERERFSWDLGASS